ncbi:Pancreatic triacylglycerol lipase [Lonchura striata]|uniref:Triacylglycerol lipase n=1 Tax=Lonchura striata TaxID=40157 RepID=A0A218UI87_9PASE|nr:Pancreatic triacylglycerol lipase [Lonchura striata domestica]
MVVGMWIVAFYLLGRVAGKEVCYPRLGCFTDDPPWSGVPGRLLTGLPDPPEEMNITFSLYTRETGNNSQLLLEVENINCIAVDWKEGAKGTYASAVNNIRVLGAEVAYFITALQGYLEQLKFRVLPGTGLDPGQELFILKCSKEKFRAHVKACVLISYHHHHHFNDQKMFGYSPYEIHLIGHSLGAHAAGEAGRRIRGVRRITGLDPAGPYFEGTPPMVRLDPTDANFVDVIHSNAAHFPVAGFGMYNTTGHLDFYPNGGTVMPGCTDLISEMKQSDFEAIIADATLFGGCHHSRSHEFYFSSILYPSGYLAYPCDSYEDFKKGFCFPCPQEGCPMMGHYADRFPEKLNRVDQKYFLNTAADEPFATWRQKVFIKLSGIKKTRGDINLVYYDRQGNSKEYEVASGDLSQDEVYTQYLDVEINPKNTTKIEFLWNKAVFSLLWARLGAEKVNIIQGADGRRCLEFGFLPCFCSAQQKEKLISCLCLGQSSSWGRVAKDTTEESSEDFGDEQEGREVCFERLGCFTDDVPWSGTVERPIYKLPWKPERVGTQFLLYTRENTDVYQEVSAVDNSTIKASNFNESRKTRFIVHGFIDNGEENWLSDMCKRMLTVEDVNCICVNWMRGARCQYTQASNNARVVGAEIAYFVNVLMDEFGYSPADVHIIGHSLGAHVAGEAGRRRPGIGRITGLDPAQPYFQGTPIEVRLDKSDADFVDIIHTDSAPTIPNLGFGMSPAIGHIDFYPNGGKEMPGCGKNPISQIVDLDGIWEGTRDFVACNHLRSYKYYSDSIIYPDGFLGYLCPSYELFQECQFEALQDKKVPHKLWSLVEVWRYKVNVTVSGKSKVRGYVNVALYGTGGNTKQYQITKGTLKPGNTYTAYIDAEVNVGEVTKVKFLWNNNWINPTLPKLGASTITVEAGQNRTEYHFCGSETVREDVLQTLTAC